MALRGDPDHWPHEVMEKTRTLGSGELAGRGSSSSVTYLWDAEQVTEPARASVLGRDRGLTPATLAVKRTPGGRSAVAGNRLSRSVVHSGFSTISSTNLSTTPYKTTWTSLGGLT